MGLVNSVERKNYVLTVRIPISCIDDCDARIKAKEMISEMDIDDSKIKLTKLQEVFGNKEPRGVSL